MKNLPTRHSVHEWALFQKYNAYNILIVYILQMSNLTDNIFYKFQINHFEECVLMRICMQYAPTLFSIKFNIDLIAFRECEE